MSSSLTAELEQKMQEIIDRQQPHPGDQEADHLDADALLVAAARSAGFGTLCDLYVLVDKWYA